MDPYADNASPLPRSVMLALWLGASSRPGAGDAVTRAAAAVQGDDEPHVVDGLGGAANLATLLETWSGDASARRATAVAALLPAPGDSAAVPVGVAHDAVDAGECVLVETPGGSFAAVPHVDRFGSDLEPGHLVRWHVQPVEPWRLRLLGTLGTLEEAERGLRRALATAVEALDALDVSRWREDAAAEIARLREPVDLTPFVPRGLDPRRVRALSQAVRLGAIVRLATVDDGAAVNVFQTDQRDAALRSVEVAARHAMAAASVVPGPGDRD
ncbi:hypothetical protein [Luteimicrobium subarcticum]|uniref:Uncharacterized protein n=1 Tax=Luteimicrobium subarcticum TaxID=620910 RepID=A0A2M8WWE9_9MICO|nr:hypothetical protein [Luteimicrobium subarcticum]PJI95247.1 hypothetical protein CLV34_0010 [Luteimicrobium subarcticum]